MSMAELPELEILRRDLDKDVVGKKIKTVEAPSAATIKRAGTKKSLISRLEGAKIDSVSRKATWILLGLDTGEVLMIGLGDRAQLLHPRPRHVECSRGHSQRRPGLCLDR